MKMPYCRATVAAMTVVAGIAFCLPAHASSFSVGGSGSGSNLGSPNSQGYYWSSTPDSEDSHFAWHLYFNSNNFRQYIYYGRQYGLSVRPVRDAD